VPFVLGSSVHAIKSLVLRHPFCFSPPFNKGIYGHGPGTTHDQCCEAGEIQKIRFNPWRTESRAGGRHRTILCANSRTVFSLDLARAIVP
jgi:hypothetical protein